jgi:pimeloyl-ACP methyl ester carboxylesterase
MSQSLPAFAPTQRVQLSNGPVAYRQVGNGFPLLLLHGWGGSSRYWQDTLNLFADVRSIYAPDLPGHGETPPIQDETSAERLATLVIEFADALGLEQFDLNGHSLGGAVAVYIAARCPERVRKLVITSLGTFRSSFEEMVWMQTYYQMSMGMLLWRPWLLLWRPWLKLWQPWLDWFVSQPPVYRLLASPFLHQMPVDERVLLEGALEFLRADRLTALENAISAGSPAFVPALRKVQAPVLVVCGDQDLIMPTSGAEMLAQQLTQSRLVELQACGHIPMIEQSAEYHNLLREFLTAEV